MRGRVCHGIRCQNGAGDLLFQARLRCQRIEQIVCRQSVVLLRLQSQQLLSSFLAHAALCGTGDDLIQFQSF